MVKTFLKATYFMNLLSIFISSRTFSSPFFTLNIIEDYQFNDALESLTSGWSVLMILFLNWVLYVCFFPPKENIK